MMMLQQYHIKSNLWDLVISDAGIRAVILSNQYAHLFYVGERLFITSTR